MADAQRTIHDLPELAETPADADELELVDVSDETESTDGTSKRVTRENLVGGLASQAGLDAVDNALTAHESDTSAHGVSGNVVGDTDAQELTNKTIIDPSNVVEEVTSIASSATPTPTGGSLRNVLYVTALALGATFGAPSGTPVNGNKLIIRVKDDGTGRSLNWNVIYRAVGVTLPTTTVANKIIYMGAIYNSADTKWDVLAVQEEE